MTTETFDAALRYTTVAGFSVIPTRINDKRPYFTLLPRGSDGKPTWTPFMSQIAGEEVVRRWFANTDAGTALVFGRVSGSAELIDFDHHPPEHPRAFEEFAALLDDLAPGLLARLVIACTQHDGRHLIYRCAEIAENQKLAQYWTTDPETGNPKTETLIETRGERGYALCAPSPGYQFLQGDLTTVPTITVEERKLLHDLARSFDAVARDETPIPTTAPAGVQKGANADGLQPGDDYNERTEVADLANLLTKHGWTEIARSGDVIRFRRPGKKDGISATLNHIPGKFYVFSSNAYPFDLNRAYDPFGVYARLEHGGDFTAATRELGRQGYGSQPVHRGNGAGAHPPEEPPGWIDARDDFGELPVADEEDLVDALILPKGFDLFKYEPEDGGILDAWLALCGEDWLYVPALETWYMWSETHWLKDQRLALQRQVVSLLAALNTLANRTWLTIWNQLQPLNDENDPSGTRRAALAKKAKRWGQYIAATKRSNGRVASIVGMAAAMRAVALEDLDAGDILNLANGTLDLTTLTLRPHQRTDHLTYRLDYIYDPAAECPRWRQFIGEVIVKERDPEHGDTTLIPDLQTALLYQELAGYSLTRDTRHEVMVWQAGNGGNGKTVAIKVLQGLLGALATPVDFHTIGLPSNYDMAKVPNKRVIFSTEATRGGKVAEEWIKRLVSGEMIGARAIYGRPFDFVPVAKIWWSMNDKPAVSDSSNAIWRRLKLIEFIRTFDDDTKDPDLADKLLAELPGILNWTLVGLRRLRSTGRFTESETMKKAIDEYRYESNAVAQWLEEETQRTVTRDGQYVCELPAKEAYEHYAEWIKRTGRQAFGITNWGREMKRLKVPFERKRSGIKYALILAAPKDEVKTPKQGESV